jgi:hypothetical protein
MAVEDVTEDSVAVDEDDDGRVVVVRQRLLLPPFA